jgi:hypothetical protein
MQYIYIDEQSHLCGKTAHLLYKVDHAAEMDSELSHHSEDGVHVEDVGQRPLL